MANNILGANVEYAFEFNKERYNRVWSKVTPMTQLPPAITVQNGYALPLRHHPDCIWGKGGVAFEDGTFVPDSGTPPYMDRTYPFDKTGAPYLHGEYVYLGLFVNHWGHFIVDVAPRLYAALQYPDAKFLFIHTENGTLPQFYPAIDRFLEIIGLKNKAVFTHVPTRIEKLIVPSLSYMKGGYVTKEYLSVFKYVAERIKPTIKTRKNIFLSRNKWNKAARKDFGNELVDELFKRDGFDIVCPEELSLDNQIGCLLGADKVGFVSGTLAHNMIFCQDYPKDISFVAKSYLLPGSLLDHGRFAECNISFLDFYACRFPIGYGDGPFILVRNKNMEKYMADKNISADGCYLFSRDHEKENIKAYLDSYYSRKIYASKWNLHSQDKDNHAYFHPQHFYDWFSNYIAYESQIPQQKTEQKADSRINGKLDRYLALERGIFGPDREKPLLAYEAHLSMLGWSGACAGDGVAGVFGEGYPIEAIRIRVLHPSASIFYAVYYGDDGWTERSANGAISGTTGKSKKINGFKIWLGELANDYSIEYRAHDKSWSEWVKDGQEIVCKNSITAFQARLAKAK